MADYLLCDVGDTIAFENQDGRSGMGTVERIRDRGNDNERYAVRVIKSTARMDAMSLHHCGGIFDEPVGWNVWPCHVTEVLSLVEVKQDDLMEVLNHG